MFRPSLLALSAALTGVALFGGAPGCICIETDACLKFCDKVVNECSMGGCTCSIDRCKNSLDVAFALNDCYELPCEEYLACANEAIALCELKDEWLDAGVSPARDAGGGADSARPDTSVPDTSVPDTSRPDAARPDLSLPDLWLPDLVYPDVSGTDTESMDLARPDIVLPDVVMPDRYDAGLTADCPTGGVPCDDGEWCTVNDVCVGTVCTGEPRDCDEGISCTTDTCNEAIDQCEHDQGVPTPGLEGYMGDPTCANGLDDDCDGYTDAGDTDCWLQGCGLPGDCDDDGNSCTAAVCDLGYCEHLPLDDGAACPGSDACTTSFWCRDAICVPGPSETDLDGDGAIDHACPNGLDCDDDDPAIKPGAEGPRGDATCSDDVDNDCDGMIDQWDPQCWDPLCAGGGFCWQSPLTRSDDLGGVYAAAPDDVWAVGDDGLILHWDDTQWSEVPSPTSANLNAISGCAADEIWAAGSSGAVIRYDGQDWNLVNNSDSSALLDIHCVGSASAHAWAVGSSDKAHHFTTGTQEHFVDVSGGSLYRVWAEDADHVWVVGDAGSLTRYVTGTWHHEPVVSAYALTAIFSVDDELWVADSRGGVFYNDGGGWIEDPSSNSDGVEDLWGLSRTDLWGVTDPWGYILHRDATGWDRADLVRGFFRLRDISGTASDDVWIVGEDGIILHYDGVEWFDPKLTYEYLYDVCVWESAGGELEAWAIGAVALRWDGAQWRVQHNFGARPRAVLCRGDQDAWAVGDSGAMFHWNGLEWEDHSGVTTADLLAIDGLDPSEGDDMVAVGTEGVALRWNGVSWTSQHLDAIGGADLRGVWVEGPAATEQVWAVGTGGTVVFWDERGWQPMQNTGTTEQLNAVWGDGLGKVWAVGENNTVLEWAPGVGWSSVAEGGWSYDYDDITGTAADDLWLVTGYYLVHWDGMAWSSEALGASIANSIAMLPAGDMWLVGGEGGVLYRGP